MAWGLEHISSLELAEWAAEYSIEPFGELRADLQAAIITSMIANANRDPAKKREPFSPVDFMPNFDEPVIEKKRQTWQEQLALAEMYNAAWGGVDLRKKDGNPSDPGGNSSPIG